MRRRRRRRWCCGDDVVFEWRGDREQKSGRGGLGEREWLGVVSRCGSKATERGRIAGGGCFKKRRRVAGAWCALSSSLNNEGKEYWLCVALLLGSLYEGCKTAAGAAGGCAGVWVGGAEDVRGGHVSGQDVEAG